MSQLRNLKIDTAQTTFLRVGLKWDALERDKYDGFYPFETEEQARAQSLDALKKANNAKLTAKLLDKSFFFARWSGKYERLYAHHMAAKFAADRYLEQHHLESFDLDLCCFCYDEQGKLVEFVTPLNVGRLRGSKDEPAFLHSGDDTTGTGETYDEELMVLVRTIDHDIHRIFFIIVSAHHGFDEVPRGHWDIVSTKNEKLLLSAKLGGQPHKLHVMAKLSRDEQGWRLEEIADYFPLDENEAVPLDQRVDQLIRKNCL